MTDHHPHSFANKEGLLDLLGRINMELQAGLETETESILPGVQDTALQDIGRHVCFALGDELLAIPLSSVLEVGDLQNVQALPLLPAWLSGISNLRGEILSVVDLARFLGWQNGASLKTRPFFVVHDESIKLAITVGRILGTRTLYSSGREQEVGNAFSAGRAIFKDGEGEREVKLFDLKAFLASETLRELDLESSIGWKKE